MILCFVAGAIFSTVLCAYFKDRAIWGALIFLVILQGDLLYADLVKEKELLDQVPNGINAHFFLFKSCISCIIIVL